MGKSDPIVFNWYRSQLPLGAQRIAFMGFSGPNEFTNSFQSNQSDFLDITLGNWEINGNWNIPPETYDMVICTRCAYFAQDPLVFIKKALLITKKSGTLFVDWGLGDHWRFQNFKVGWVRYGEHESIQYGDHTSHLYSCFWDESLERDANVKAFRESITRLGYDRNLSIGDIVRQEVPGILRPTNIGPARVSTLFLWPDAPQLYISTLFVRDPF